MKANIRCLPIAKDSISTGSNKSNFRIIRINRINRTFQLWKLSRFQRKITADESKISRPKASLSSRKPVNHQHRASNDRRCLSCASCACRWPATALICKVMHAESREFRPQNCAISVPNVRAGRKRSAQTHSKCF